MKRFGRPVFYLPRTLGRPRPRAASEQERGAPRRGDHEAWREGVLRPQDDYEHVPEKQVRDRLLGTGDPLAGCMLVTGEPGAGKSMLLEAWLEAWADTRPEPRLGAAVPVVVPLRDLSGDDAPALLKETATEKLADRLWQLRLTARVGIRETVSPFHSRDGRLWHPVWLLDGLDELPETLLDERFLRRLAHLPGRVCLTCRTAVAQSQVQALAACIAPGAAYELLPLTNEEQFDYLRKCLAGDAGRAQQLHECMCGSAQIRELAGNPLLLGLIAEIGETEELPASRSEFYRRAVAALWRRRVRCSQAEELRPCRDEVLTALAAEVRLEKPIFPVAHLDRALETMPDNKRSALRRALRKSELLRIDGERERAEFLHLTMQEYYLALHLKQRPLGDTLRDLWSKPRYEETLALLLASAVGDGRLEEADRALHDLVVFGRETHRRDPSELWRLGRSPMRTVLHIVHRAGLELADFEKTKALLGEMLDGSHWLRTAAATDEWCPQDLLVRLAADEEKDVRWTVAENPTTPAEVLARLTRDRDEGVRRAVAWNSATPAEALARLARDGDKDVRWAVALNSATPAEALACLAADVDKRVRRAVAENNATPAEALARPAADVDKRVRRAVARNRATPAEALARLAGDGDKDVRGAVAENSATPAKALVRLAADWDKRVRRAVAWNSATPAEALVRLAADRDEGVRRAVAWNSATPAEALARLARDGDKDVRWAVASKNTTPAEVLASLAADRDKNVRCGVAQNPATPAEALARLARDQEGWVREAAAANPATLLEDLAAISE